MTEITFAAIEPLVATKTVQGSSVDVTFQCPDSGEEVSSKGQLRRATSVKAEATRSVKKNLWRSMRSSVTRAVADALGNGTAGKIARDVANQSLRAGEQKTAFGKEEVQAGVVEAFKAVQSSFKFDEKAGGWRVAKKPANAFEQRLADAPITERYDQGVLARALIELSAADGEVTEEELAFIADFIDPEIGTVDELAKRDALTPQELGEASEAARGTILMLSWACAMCDEDLDDAEAARLGELASGFGLDEAAADTLRADAQRFLVDQALAGVYASGARDDDAFGAAQEAATKMGIDSDAFGQWDAAFRRAAGVI